MLRWWCFYLASNRDSWGALHPIPLHHRSWRRCSGDTGSSGSTSRPEIHLWKWWGHPGFLSHFSAALSIANKLGCLSVNSSEWTQPRWDPCGSPLFPEQFFVWTTLTFLLKGGCPLHIVARVLHLGSRVGVWFSWLSSGGSYHGLMFPHGHLFHGHYPRVQSVQAGDNSGWLECDLLAGHPRKTNIHLYAQDHSSVPILPKRPDHIFKSNDNFEFFDQFTNWTLILEAVFPKLWECQRTCISETESSKQD